MAFLSIIDCMHNIYTFTRHVSILAAVLYIVALRFCSGKTIPIKNNYENPKIPTTQNAGVAQTTMGIDDFRFMKLLKHRNVLAMFTSGTFAHAQVSSACAFQFLVKLLGTLKKIRFKTSPNTRIRNMRFLGFALSV